MGADGAADRPAVLASWATRSARGSSTRSLLPGQVLTVAKDPTRRSSRQPPLSVVLDRCSSHGERLSRRALTISEIQSRTPASRPGLGSCASAGATPVTCRCGSPVARVPVWFRRVVRHQLLAHDGSQFFLYADGTREAVIPPTQIPTDSGRGAYAVPQAARESD